MACTTILVGKKATYDGSTLIARNEDCGNGEIHAKRFGIVLPQDQPRTYTTVGSHLTIELTETPMSYTYTPDANLKLGIFGEAGINEANVAMTATETISTNARVLGADPYVALQPAKGNPGDADYVAEVPGGIGEEDLVTIILPYIHSAREGVERMGSLLEKYGTYESNGVAFSDADEIWWIETIGGHHWIARRVPDDRYVVMPNQFGLDNFDFSDAFGQKKDHMCSADLKEFITENFLDVAWDDQSFNPRDAFGSHSDADHVYNTPRAWAMARHFNPHLTNWDSQDSLYKPESDDIPWSFVPEKKITVEDVKYILGYHYQGTPYDPYQKSPEAGKYRNIGINRTCEMGISQIRGYMPEDIRAVQWVGLACNTFNALVPIYTNVKATPEYISNTTDHVTTDCMYWTNRLIGALADAHFADNANTIEFYQLAMAGYGHQRINEIDKKAQGLSGDELHKMLEQENDVTTAYIKDKTDELLGKVLFVAYSKMKNSYYRNDN